MSAVVIGDALIDEIRDASGVRELVGGAALNVAVGLRRLGVETTLIAMVGDDEAGAHIREYLRDHGVRLIESPSPRGSSRAVVTWSPAGEPQYAFNEAARGRSIRYDEAERAAISDADVVAISCFPFDRSDEVDALVDALGDARVAVDPNPRSGMMGDVVEFVRGFERLAARAELVKVGADDATLLYDGDLDALRERLRGLGAMAVLATAGAEGAVLESDARVFRAPIATLPGPVVDTVGAGDATLAAVVAGLSRGEPKTDAEWQRLMDDAMLIAAATCRAEGGLLRTPESLHEAERGVFGS
ncbi:carbohydrate kinase family protein [Microbacterium sp. nov. GSS16]|uniref:carbohydrate kinase family protein n=1 Tax=Microbacterium sp. nov. GSS16 TaxID=3019890 RepID=UPI002305F4FB|nr:PfkB family carbohydrate kinase [Microbacterium sp. nov. GSS16]MEE2815729.1 PfkB family carbohydrate kinase [Actinomycetota bacterium]WCD92945.1 PfkB family carbohydrate kinase [Microbacterium sp. nov. GSS16]